MVPSARKILFSTLLTAVCINQVGAVEPSSRFTEIGCAVEGIDWQLVRLDGVAWSFAEGSDGERRPFLNFDEANKRVQGFAGCNSFSAGYSLDEEALKFDSVTTTRMACPAEREALERAFLAALAAATGLQVGETNLQLLAGERPVAEFRAP